MVPADVYRAARRAYTLTAPDLCADDEVVRHWAVKRWPKSPINDMAPELVAFWVMSIAAQDGNQ